MRVWFWLRVNTIDAFKTLQIKRLREEVSWCTGVERDWTYKALGKERALKKEENPGIRKRMLEIHEKSDSLSDW